jgi:hypothetical protein
MTLRVLIRCLNDLKKRHPELENEEVKVYFWRGHSSNSFQIIESVNYMTNDLKCVIELSPFVFNLK